VTTLLRGELGVPSEVQIDLQSVKEEETGEYRFALFLLLSAASMLLLVACANVANLLMSEAATRSREISTRMSLGASRCRVVRLLLVEAILLALGGSLLGIGLAVIGVKAVVTYGPYLPGLESVGTDLRVLLFATSLGLVTGMGFGLAPAMQGTRLSSLPRWTVGTGRKGGFQRNAVAVVFEITTVLLAAGGLLTRSFWRLSHLDLGFRAENLATIRLPILPDRYDGLERRDVFLLNVIENIEAIPGVTHASGADNLPFPGARSGHAISLPGGEGELSTPLRRVLPDYHEVMGIPLVAGRGFLETDVEGQTPVAILSGAAARHFWPDGSAIGRLVHHGAYGDLTVVGVVGEVTEGWVEREAKPMIYLPLPQTTQDEITLIARTSVDPQSILRPMREGVWAVDPEVAVTMETTMASLVADSNLAERYRTLLIGFFAISASILAAMGIFAVTARSIAARIRELGIRAAVGAQKRDLVGMMLRENIRTAMAGTAVGLVVSYWASSLLSRFLFRTDPLDPLTFGAIPAFLALICLSAGYSATRQILRMDPVSALKVE
jgi:putative ABC transport system permease protein